MTRGTDGYGGFVAQREARRPGRQEEGSGLVWGGTGEGQRLVLPALGAELAGGPRTRAGLAWCGPSASTGAPADLPELTTVLGRSHRSGEARGHGRDPVRHYRNREVAGSALGRGPRAPDSKGFQRPFISSQLCGQQARVRSPGEL